MKLAQLFGKNQLDEMQERTMLTIESRGFWLVWSLLLVVLLGEGLLGFTMREMAGTWAVFMIGCVYIVAACLRAGLWSRRIKNDYRHQCAVQPCGCGGHRRFYICKDVGVRCAAGHPSGLRGHCGGLYLRAGTGGTPALRRSRTEKRHEELENEA